MGWLKDHFSRRGRMTPAPERGVVIREPLSFELNVLKNRLWYRGEPSELEQFFRQSAASELDWSRFWVAAPQDSVRKLHSGIVGTVVDRYTDMVVTDFDGIVFGEDGQKHPLLDRWLAAAEACRFPELLGEAVAGALITGDGAFKLSLRPGEKLPRVSFYEADRVEFIEDGRRLEEIRFYTTYRKGEKDFRLEERYGRGYVRYRLMDSAGRETAISSLPQTRLLENVTFAGDFLLAVPLKLFGQGGRPGRGRALFDGKTDVLDALDEVISQWLDAVRMGRVKRYIPEDMIPRDPETGLALPPNPFDNAYIAVGSASAEGVPERIEVSQPTIAVGAYEASYAAFLDLVLQGVMSPATLGIDLKKTDNAEAQREKEHITMHVRSRIVDALGAVLPLLAETILRTEDLLAGRPAGSYPATARFGEYASPDFGSAVETVAQAREAGVMSVEQAVEELYGDTWTAEEKAAEAARIRAGT